MNRRLMILVGVIVVFLTIVAVLLVLAVQKQRQAQQSNTPTLQLTKVLDEVVYSPVPSFDNNSIWYFNSDGKLFKVNGDGSNLSEFALPGSNGPVRFVLWPKTGPDFISFNGTAQNQTINYFDGEKNTFLKLADNIRYLDWFPDGQRIAYIWQSESGQQLVTANADGTGYTVIKDVFWPDLALRISPDGKNALLWRQQAGEVNKIYSINFETGEMGTLIEQGKNLGAMWISENRFVFAQSTSETYSKLYLFDQTTKQVMDLNLSAPLNKIAMTNDGQTLYVAKPSSDNSGDSFVKVNLSSYQVENHFDPQTPVNVKSMLMAGNIVYFVNSDNKLYRITSP